jgi:hypothetical protein
MPFSRPQNIPALVSGMEGQGVVWRPLVNVETMFPTEATWIQPWHGLLPKKSDGTPAVNPGNWMIDAFLDYAVQYEEDFFDSHHYVSFMTDDCLWNHRFWRKLQRHFKDGAPQEERPVVTVCATLAHSGGVPNLVPAVHNADKVKAAFWETTLRCFATRLEALTVRADLLKDARIGPVWCGDGLLVERLVEENEGKIALANECCVYFNGLRPECWGFPPSHQR